MNVRKLTYLAMLISLGLALHIMEGFIPNPFIGIAPGAKLGLANIIGLITLVIYGVKYALTVNVLRCIIAGVASGAITSMMYSVSGAILSTLLMWAAFKLFRKYFSLVGVSVIGALGHNIAQLTVAALIINNIRIFTYLPVMMFASIFTGIFIGLTCNFILERSKTILKNTLNTI